MKNIYFRVMLHGLSRQWVAVLIAGLFISVSGLAQKHLITGKVSDESGELMIGVSVKIKNTTTGTITNFDGRYSIESVSAKDVLEFSYVGYETKTVQVGNKSVIDIVLSEDTKLLDEIVVVGYGTQKKSDLTGSVVSVKADDMNAIPTSSVAEMLRGQAAGIVVTQNSARPGGTSDIVIRGKKSLGGSGGNAPLFIVDGVPVSNIDDFNSQDILSVEVLKDASSQSIYGARASNGVILITTKRGADNKTTVDFSTYLGTQQLKRNFDFYSGEEWVQLKREANRSLLGGDPDENGIYPGDASLFGNMYQNLLNKKYTNWEDLMIKPALQQKYDLSIRSGGPNTKISASLGYFNQEGMIKPASYDRANFRFNADHKLSNKVALGLNVNYTQSNRTQEDESFSKFITQSPLLNPFNDDGSLKDILEDSKWNPIWNNQNMLNESKSNRLLLNATFDWEIIKGLKYRLNASLNSRTSEQGTYLNSFHEKGSNSKGVATIEMDQYDDYLLENIFTYDYKINEINKLDATFVQSINSIKSYETIMSGSGFSTDDLGYNNIGAAAKTDPVSRSITPRFLLSYMGRVRYNLADRYLFSASARIDGSSVFGANNKWGLFPAASFAWRVSEEEFLSEAEWLSNLKLRLSYGAVGNQAISPYQSQGLVNSYFFQFGSGDPFVGYLPGSQLPNPNLRWETTSSLNAGVDFGILKDKISGTLEYYHSITSDLLLPRSINQITGYSSQMVNVGEVLNQGVELTLNFIPVKTKDFTWNLDVSVSANENKILALNGELDEEGKPKNDIANRWFIGYNTDAYYDYQFDGIWQTDDVIPDFGPNYKPEPGDIKVKDVDKDGLITTEDRIIINRAPKWVGSIGSVLKWKNVDFSFDFYTVQGAIRSNPYLYDSNSGGDLHGKLNGIKVDYWTPENPSNTAPRPRDATINYFSALSYQDASYIRLRNLSLGYNFPKKMIDSVGIKSLRIYGTATNIWTQTDFLSYSPEVSAGGYPEPKTFVVGLNVSF
ncbi:MAG: TonB-dependent receptor [Paludibacter sp.]|nr:TonB-dependent receptor [Paludibacter sp.]